MGQDANHIYLWVYRMSNYIEIRNRSNIVTINDEYKSLSFVEKQNGNQAVNKMNFIEIDSRIGVAAIAVSSPDVLT